MKSKVIVVRGIRGDEPSLLGCWSGHHLNSAEGKDYAGRWPCDTLLKLAALAQEGWILRSRRTCGHRFWLLSDEFLGEKEMPVSGWDSANCRDLT